MQLEDITKFNYFYTTEGNCPVPFASVFLTLLV